MQPDEHAENGKYEIRSLYFDSLSDKTLREKIWKLYVQAMKIMCNIWKNRRINATV